MKKISLFILLILVGAVLATAVFAQSYYGYTQYGVYHEYPTASYRGMYYPNDYYPSRYYYRPDAYDITSNLYRYGVRTAPVMVEQPSYAGFLTQIESNAKEGQLCGVLQNKFYNCEAGLTCQIVERQIGTCVRASMI